MMRVSVPRRWYFSNLTTCTVTNSWKFEISTQDDIIIGIVNVFFEYLLFNGNKKKILSDDYGTDLNAPVDIEKLFSLKYFSIGIWI